MVRGLDIFKKYFEQFPDSYVIIGGTACDILMDQAGFIPRATKDIDIILVVEALDSDFVKQFWKFVEDGNYELKEKSDEDRKYYRFIKPGNKEFPFQLELFSRNPDLLDLDENTHLPPIPVDDGLTSLSAILMDDDYYNYLRKHCTIENELHRADTEALICLKAKAFLDMVERKVLGEKIDDKNIGKHKKDVFRLAVLLAENDVFELPASIKTDLQDFVSAIADELPDNAVFKEMGLSNITAETVYNQIIKSFQLDK